MSVNVWTVRIDAKRFNEYLYTENEKFWHPAVLVALESVDCKGNRSRHRFISIKNTSLTQWWFIWTLKEIVKSESLGWKHSPLGFVFQDRTRSVHFRINSVRKRFDSELTHRKWIKPPAFFLSSLLNHNAKCQRCSAGRGGGILETTEKRQQTLEL